MIRMQYIDTPENWQRSKSRGEEEILHLKVNPVVGGSFSFQVRRDRSKLHWQPVTTLQMDRAWHSLEKGTDLTTGTRIGVAESGGTAPVIVRP